MRYTQDNPIKCRLAAQFLEYIVLLRQLKHIRLTFSGGTLKWAPEIISQLPPSVSKITLIFSKPNLIHSESGSTWSQLDHTLVGMAPASVCDLVVIVRNYWSYLREEHRKALLRCLPRCVKKKTLILDFQHENRNPFRCALSLPCFSTFAAHDLRFQSTLPTTEQRRKNNQYARTECVIYIISSDNLKAIDDLAK
jgi:hypothetical protein